MKHSRLRELIEIADALDIDLDNYYAAYNNPGVGIHLQSDGAEVNQAALSRIISTYKGRLIEPSREHEYRTFSFEVNGVPIRITHEIREEEEEVPVIKDTYVCRVILDGLMDEYLVTASTEEEAREVLMDRVAQETSSTSIEIVDIELKTN